MGSESTERRLQAVNTDWGVDILGQRDDTIENFVVRGGPNVPYYHTLVEAPIIDGVGGGKGGRTCIAIERDPKGSGYCGLAVITLSRSKGPKGRWHVVVEREVVFVSETEHKVIVRATRASVVNPDHEKLTDDDNIDVGHGWSNPRRIGGPPIKVELEIQNWSPQLAKAGRLMDIAQFADVTEEFIGPGALMKAIRKLPVDIRLEVLEHLATDPASEADAA